MRRGLLVSGAARCPFAEVQGSRGGLHLLCLKRASKLHLGFYFSFTCVFISHHLPVTMNGPRYRRAARAGSLLCRLGFQGLSGAGFLLRDTWG